jgi:Reverse transcriptase (RNA-dependent DNA polymerase)/DNA N-6-adenine-methyltransferase (Dam)
LRGGTPTKTLYKHSKTDHHLIEEEILQLLCKRAIEEVSPHSYGFRSQLFTIPKKTGERRPVLNLRPLNKYVPRKHFKMESLKMACTLINRGDYLTSIDLADAFLHVLVHQSSRRYLQFAWDGRLFQFRVLPFGLSLSPMVFTKVVRPVLRWARRKGIRLSAYLDDLLIVSRSLQTARAHTRMVQRKLQDLGFMIKATKSVLRPTQKLQHLGFLIDTRDMTLTVPSSKIRDLRREASRLFRSASCSLRHLSSFIGKAQAMTIAVFPARLQTRHLLTVKNLALRRCPSWTSTVSLPAPALLELQWWHRQLQSWNGQSFLPATPQHEVFTDASDLGWGIVWHDQTWSGQWGPQEVSQHINWKELMVIWKVTQLRHLQGSVIRVYCDNMTTIAYVNKFGGTKSAPLLELARRIWNSCLRTNTRILLTYVPSLFNPADAPSRQLAQQVEWRMSRTYFQRLDQKWGPHQVDLFAHRNNHLLPRYVAWRPDPQAVAHDALQMSWQHLGRLYICPPWNLLPAIVQKIQREQVSATLITPWWPTAIWFPSLRTIARPRPLSVPRQFVLPPIGHTSSALQGNPHWSLTAWNINFAA